MAAALLRRGAGLCVRCLHRELCRVVWRPQAALFSSKPSDTNQPRRTHIKKAKPQPAVDVAKLLEQIFSQRRPGTAPPAGKARPTKASPASFKPPSTSSAKASASEIPPSTKTDPSVSVIPAASSLKQVDGVSMKRESTFSAAPPSHQTKSVPPADPDTSCSPETPQQAHPDSTVPHTSIIKPSPTSVESVAAAIAQRAPAETIKDSIESVTVEPLTIETPVEPRLSPVETLEIKTSVAEGPAQPAVDVPIEYVEHKVIDLIETTVESPVETSHVHVQTSETAAAVAEGPVESTVDTRVDAAAETQSSNSGVVDISQTSTAETLIDKKIEPSVEGSSSHLEKLEDKPAAGNGSVGTTIETEAVDSLNHSALIQKAEESESTKKSEKMSLESVTLHTVEVQVEALKTDELLQIKSVLDEKAEEELQELFVQSGTGAEHKAAAKTENPSEDESEILTKALEKWDSLPEDLQELEGESGMLVNELLCSVPAGTMKTSPASDPPTGVSGESLKVEEKGTEVEAMTLESITLANVKAEVGGFETVLLQETRNALEKEAEVLAKDEKIEVKVIREDVNVFEDAAEAELLSLESISEATEAIEAETSVMMEAMFGSEQGLRQPDQKVGQQGEPIGQESGEQEGRVLEAMTLESVTLAEVEASLRTLENTHLGEAKDYLEKEAEVLAKEKKMEVQTTIEDVDVFQGTSEAEILTLESVSETTDAIEAEMSIVMEAMFGSEQGPKLSDTLSRLGKQREEVDRETEKDSGEQEGRVLEAMTLESVTLAEVEASLRTLENTSLNEAKDYLEKEVEVLVKEETMEVKPSQEDVSVFENAAEAELLSLESISEATDAIEAETSVMMEAMFGSEQGLRNLPGTLPKLGQQQEVIDHEAGKESGEQEGSVLEAMTLESVTLAEVEASLRTLENTSLSEAKDYLEKEAEVLAKEEIMEVKITLEDVDVFEDAAEADISRLESISEATDAIEAETSIMMEAMFGSEQGSRQLADTLPKLEQQQINQETEESAEQEGKVLEAMTLESVTLAEVESDYLEKETRMETEDVAASKGTTEDLKIEGDAQSEGLQRDEVMEELLFSVPGHVTQEADGQTGQEAASANTQDATVATGSVDVDAATAVTEGFPASPTLEEEQLLRQEEEAEEEVVGAQTEASGVEDGKGQRADLDPVQTLFLEKIREYKNMQRLNGGALEAEPDYEKHLSEEIAKLQRLYGGGDLNSFPEFTFTEPEMDQDSK